MTEETSDARRAEEHYKLLFAARRSVLYHRHRQRFLERVHNVGSLLTAFGGSATVATLLSRLPEAWALAAATVTAFSGAHELVFGTARGARLHDGLAREFVALEQELVRAGPGLSAEKLIDLQMRRLDIEANEPPIYRVLDAMCHDQLLTALGREDEHRTNVAPWQRWLRNLVTDPGLSRIRKRADVK